MLGKLPVMVLDRRGSLHALNGNILTGRLRYLHICIPTYTSDFMLYHETYDIWKRLNLKSVVETTI